MNSNIDLDCNKTYLITGGSGFLGEALISHLQDKNIKKLKIVARNEGNLIKLKEKYNFIEIIPGDISDEFICEKAVQNVNGVFHLAAFKHVGLAETHTRECVNGNVLGSLNILECSLKHNFDFVLGISTDKAAQVKGVYGATKLLQERLFKEYEQINNKTKYRTVRYGNVLYSTGSVLCKWRDKLQSGDEIIVTDSEATRFYWTVDQAIDLIFNCLKNAKSASPFVPEMKSIKIGDLLEAMVIKYLPKDKQLKIKTIGLQAGENKHELILESGPASNEVECYSVEEILKLI
jgi:UDP-N-acetylglucosamine 4,6-dehydratase